MKKVRISLQGKRYQNGKTKYPIGGRRYPLVGLTFHEVESVEELRKFVEEVEQVLKKHFPSAEIVKTPALKRDLFGE